jgi:hypothetical protein
MPVFLVISSRPIHVTETAAGDVVIPANTQIAVDSTVAAFLSGMAGVRVTRIDE